jgi:hypothetical protein
MNRRYQRFYHFAAKVNASGGVSALCFVRPLAINLRRASWTLRREAVTCAKCQQLLEATREPIQRRS